MKKKFWIGFGLVLVIGAAVLGWRFFGDAEPSYQGKKVGFGTRAFARAFSGELPALQIFPAPMKPSTIWDRKWCLT